MMSNSLVNPAQLSFAHLPTPIHFLPRLSEELGAEIYVKRDDFTGLEWSGNKIRKLEYLAAEAQAKNATCLVTFGGLQSNHCRATAAIAARLGLRCVLVLRGKKPEKTEANYLLDKLFGAEIVFVTDEEYRNPTSVRAAIDAQVRSQGGRAYFIPEGGSNALGSWGYVQAWREIEMQAQADPAHIQNSFNSLLLAHGSGGTQAGLILGKLLSESKLLSDCRIWGVNVAYDREKSFQLVKDILWSAIQQFRLPISFMPDDINVLDGFIGLGYAQNTREELEFFWKVARAEGLLLDPTYTGKAFWGLWQTVKKDKTFFGKKILFLHTGGSFGQFKLSAEWGDLFGG